GVLAIVAFCLAWTAHPSRRPSVRTGTCVAISVALIALGVIGFAIGNPGQLAWVNIFFGAAFGILALVSAYGGTGGVVRHPADDSWSHLTLKEIEDRYGPPENLTGFEYQQRGGYLKPDRDENIFGTHWGVGPRGYQRTDIQIGEEICERLARRGDLDASGIEV